MEIATATIGSVSLEIVRGDITNQEDIAAIVNAANAELQSGGGVAGAIHRAAGEGLAKECRPMAPISPGEAVITSAHDLPNEYVVHCLGPVYGQDKPEDVLLANCYINAMELAEEHDVESIAFPAISTGAFGFPPKKAADVALSAIADYAINLQNVKLIRMVLFGEDAAEIHRKKLKEIA